MPLLNSSNIQEFKKFKRKADNICKFVLEVGNFGHKQRRDYSGMSYVTRKFVSFWGRLSDMLRHFRIFPLDSIRFFGGVLRSGLHAVIRGEWDSLVLGNYGFTDLRIYGFTELGIHGLTASRAYGIVDLRIYGCAAPAIKSCHWRTNLTKFSIKLLANPLRDWLFLLSLWRKYHVVRDERRKRRWNGLG